MNDKQFKKAIGELTEDCVKQMDDCGCFLGVYTESFKDDPLCALQLGVAILKEKPIGVIALKGAHVPEKLKKIADFTERQNSADDLKETTTRLMDKMTTFLEKEGK
jgi:hypothetical protein